MGPGTYCEGPRPPDGDPERPSPRLPWVLLLQQCPGTLGDWGGGKEGFSSLQGDRRYLETKLTGQGPCVVSRDLTKITGMLSVNI